MITAAGLPSPPKSPPPKAPGNRYSLRTLFFISVVVAVPFLLLANTRSFARPDDSLGSPLYLVFGVLAVVISAAVGGALGGARGTLALALAAGLSWVFLVLVCSEFSNTLRTLLPIHALAAAATVASLAYAVRTRRENPGEGPHPRLERLLKVKRAIRHGADREADSTVGCSDADPGSPH